MGDSVEESIEVFFELLDAGIVRRIVPDPPPDLNELVQESQVVLQECALID